jgi:hypothetical protein
MAILADTKLRCLKPRPKVYRVANLLGLAIDVGLLFRPIPN